MDKSEVTPFILDLGKKRRKAVKQLKRGDGKIRDEVVRVLEEVRSRFGEESEQKQLVPVVVIYEKRRKRKKRGLGRLF